MQTLQADHTVLHVELATDVRVLEVNVRQLLEDLDHVNSIITQDGLVRLVLNALPVQLYYTQLVF